MLEVAQSGVSRGGHSKGRSEEKKAGHETAAEIRKEAAGLKAASIGADFMSEVFEVAQRKGDFATTEAMDYIEECTYEWLQRGQKGYLPSIAKTILSNPSLVFYFFGDAGVTCSFMQWTGSGFFKGRSDIKGSAWHRSFRAIKF